MLGCPKKFIHCQKAKVRITVLPIMNLWTHWTSTLEFLERAYWLQEFTRKGLQIPKSSGNWPFFATYDKLSFLQYIMDVLRPFWYCTLWISKRHTVTLHHVITVYNDMLHRLDGVLWASANMMTQWKEELFFAVKFAPQKLSNYFVELTCLTGMVYISAHILNSFRKLWLYRKCDYRMDINLEDKISYTTNYQETFLKYAEMEYCAKHRLVPVNQHESVTNSTLITSAMASGSDQSFLHS